MGIPGAPLSAGRVSPELVSAGSGLAPIRARYLGPAPMQVAEESATLSGMGRSILIVDDHDGFRSFARAVLEADGFEVVGEAADGVSALEAAGRLRPDLVLLDVQLPDLDGFEVAERLAREEDPPVVVLVSTRDAASYRNRLVRTPARGFISKAELSGPAVTAVVGA